MRIGFRVFLSAILAYLAVAAPATADAAEGEPRLAFVIGEPQNASRPLPDADTQAGLIAGALAIQGFTVTAARNLSHDAFKAALTEFETEIQANPSAEVFIYLGGPIIQSGRDNIFLPVDVSANSVEDLAAKGLSITSLIGNLTRLSSGAKTIVLDGARFHDAVEFQPQQAQGLTLLLAKPAPNLLVLYNQAPGLVLVEKEQDFPAFSLALAEAIGNSAHQPLALQDYVVLRTYELSGGRQIPWSAGKLDRGKSLFSNADAAQAGSADWIKKPMNTLDPVRGFALALTQKSVESYEEYILIHIQNPMTRILRYLLTTLREERSWQEAQVNPNAASLWAYLKRYPRGPHVASARAQLTTLKEPLAPPADAALLALQTPPPSSDELARLASAPFFRFDSNNPELQTVSGQIGGVIPKVPVGFSQLPKLVPATGPFDLPAWPNASEFAGKIKLPEAAKNAVSPSPLPKLEASVPEKTTVPLPPKRRPAQEAAKPLPTPPANAAADQGATQPAPQEPAAAAAAAAGPTPLPKKPKPVLPETFGDVFEDSGVDVRNGMLGN